MLKLYRAVDVVFGRVLPDLSGISAKYKSGTWHTKANFGRDTRLIYTCESSSTCLLELLAGSGQRILPLELHMLEITGLEEKDMVTVDNLPPDWSKRDDITREIGMNWLNSNASLALRVPSKVSYESYNVLINPLHISASKLRLKIARYYPDTRLVEEVFTPLTTP